MKNKIKTRFGTAMINQDGYYEIASVKEGNQDKLLHRLIYEEYHNVKLPSQIYVHHRNGEKLDNCIFNLEALSASEHCRLHRKGAKLSEETKIKLSRLRSSLNIYRVTLERSDRYAQGFTYVYQYPVDGTRKKIRCVDLARLKEKVESKGLEWIEFQN